MSKLTFDYIEDNGLLLYKFVRGSTCMGLNTPESDVDEGGVYICPTEDIMGLGIHYQDEVHNSTNDIVWTEIGKYLQLLVNSNPTVLETLFIDDEFVLYEHPIITELKKHRDLFVTKKCFKSYFGYSSSQVSKAQGLNKLITLPVVEKKGPLDFCYTFLNQGSTKLINWLDNHGLYQKYCGLVSVPNMHNMYGVYYDWGAHYKGNQKEMDEYVHELINSITSSNQGRTYTEKEKYLMEIIEDFIGSESRYYPPTEQNIIYIFPSILGYSGIVAEDGSSNTLRYIQDNYTEKDGVMLNSVAKGQKPICYMSFNADAYAKHLRDYTRYQKWLKERNPIRYENNKGHRYDSKNMLHCFRLMNMAIEIAKGKGVLVNRRNIDRDFLLSVKNHAYSYEELMEMLKQKEKEMKQAVESCTLPDEVDIEKVNELLINIRKQFNKNESNN